MTDHACTVPFRLGRQMGDEWTCLMCGRLWRIESNEYDSLLPYGDYQWFSELEPRRRIARYLGFRHRPKKAQPEPVGWEASRLRALLYRTHLLGMDARLILSVYDLNPSAALPYHGAAHCVTVALRAAQAQKDAKGDEASQRSVILAGLFHDADYVMGASESENIPRAVAFSRSMIGENEEVESLIRATTFPHTKAESDVAALIQDADLLQAIEPDGARFFRALEEEGDTPDPDFPRPENLNTEWARERLAFSKASRSGGREG